MPDPLALISTRQTPQILSADLSQVENSSGGYAFTVDPMVQLRRFLTLGTTGGTYYVAERALTVAATTALQDLVRSNGSAVVEEVLTISTSGRAPRVNPALFALAMVAGIGDDDARGAALQALPRVARTGTHLFLFAGYVQNFRGWGRGLRRAVGSWYSDKDADALAYQMVKYASREGWTHRDLLRLAHPAAPGDAHRALYDWASGRTPSTVLPNVVTASQRAHQDGTAVDEVVREGHGLSWEMLPSASLNDRKVWEALLDNGLPLGALLRQLPRLTRLGLCDPMTATAAQIVARLTDAAALRRARLHPIAVLVALRTYASGRSVAGTSHWTPSPVIVDALDRAFYAAFGSVQPTGKRMLLALDVSGSMTSPVGGLPISCREASAALAMVTAAVEPSHRFVGFTAAGHPDRSWTERLLGRGSRTVPGIGPLTISPRQRLDDVIRSVSDLPFGRTDCALPMEWALATRTKVDVFVIVTDNETYAGRVHPHQALQEYRRAMGIDAKLVVVAMAATEFSIADPRDAGMLDVSGFDASTPQLISDFAAGII